MARRSKKADPLEGLVLGKRSTMLNWNDLSPAELTVLETIFWSSGVSRAELAQNSGFSRSKANNAVAALVERGMLDETGPQASSGGRRPETLLLSSSSHGVRDVSDASRLRRPSFTTNPVQRRPVRGYRPKLPASPVFWGVRLGLRLAGTEQSTRSALATLRHDDSFQGPTAHRRDRSRR